MEKAQAYRSNWDSGDPIVEDLRPRTLGGCLEQLSIVRVSAIGSTCDLPEMGIYTKRSIITNRAVLLVEDAAHGTEIECACTKWK
ncbi:hypothetical protein Tco_0989303 [Tanacetum coccineum]|uniref:Uncharacterized protein n=1 Tax=Tanacetum coccineum TaxID=301880 RepID=A0ABQ5ETS1_9ASTR